MDQQEQPHVRLTRASVACRRCRRLRTKCVTRDNCPPCNGCLRAGPETASECFFPARGHSHYDRDYRVDKSQASRSPKRTTDSSSTQLAPDSTETLEFPSRLTSEQQNSIILSPSPSTVSPPLLSTSRSCRVEERPFEVITTTNPTHASILPPLREVIEGCGALWTSCFQVGFFAKQLFLEKLTRDIESVSLFLLISILSLSGRFTPCLIKRYGSSQVTSRYFMKHASQLALACLYEPTLEHIQGFLLLSQAQWGHGDKTQSSINIGIAIRMAGMLRFHREETYSLPAGATTDEVVKSEIARRTFWVLVTSDNLHSSHASPAPFGPDDITALLPCSEGDFAFGRIPASRAAMPGTKVAKLCPELVSLQSRSIFATLLQAHSWWAMVAVDAHPTVFTTTSSHNQPVLPQECAEKEPLQPWHTESYFARTCRLLAEWEAAVPDEHRWNVWNMRGHSAEKVHLAYLSIVTMTRLANIVVRRVYLEEMLACLESLPERDSSLQNSNTANAPPDFWKTVAEELFDNVHHLMEPITWFMANRTENEGFLSTLLFAIYVSGSLFLQLVKTPSLCPRLVPTASRSLSHTLNLLTELQMTWPLASRWLSSLTRAAEGVSVQIMDAGVNASSNQELPTSLDMLMEAATSAAEQNVLSTTEEYTSEAFALPLQSATTEVNIRQEEMSFESELSEFLGNGNCGIMDVCVPVASGAWEA